MRYSEENLKHFKNAITTYIAKKHHCEISVKYKKILLYAKELMAKLVAQRRRSDGVCRPFVFYTNAADRE
uniref:Transposase n=1 Tax=Heterorhabditis bacteriophora TaxID=37862 RepID=A0A1I7WCJ6_HETBA